MRQHPRDRIRWLEAGVSAARKLGDCCTEGKVLGNLGIAYYRLGETHKAIEFYEGHLVIAREIGDCRGEGSVLFNLGLALYGLEEKDRAIDWVKQALEIYEAIESPYAEWAQDTLKEWGALKPPSSLRRPRRRNY